MAVSTPAKKKNSSKNTPAEHSLTELVEQLKSVQDQKSGLEKSEKALQKQISRSMKKLGIADLMATEKSTRERRPNGASRDAVRVVYASRPGEEIAVKDAAEAAGIPAVAASHAVRALMKDGVLERTARGVYKLAGAA